MTLVVLLFLLGPNWSIFPSSSSITLQGIIFFWYAFIPILARALVIYYLGLFICLRDVGTFIYWVSLHDHASKKGVHWSRWELYLDYLFAPSFAYPDGFPYGYTVHSCKDVGNQDVEIPSQHCCARESFFIIGYPAWPPVLEVFLKRLWSS